LRQHPQAEVNAAQFRLKLLVESPNLVKHIAPEHLARATYG
jgi:hypothetical protein